MAHHLTVLRELGIFFIQHQGGNEVTGYGGEPEDQDADRLRDGTC
jgi:hypothetical protein